MEEGDEEEEEEEEDCTEDKGRELRKWGENEEGAFGELTKLKYVEGGKEGKETE